MAAHYDDFWLYPAALGVLVLSKAHNVLRAAVVPRVLPAAMSLTSANARLSVFGLATAGGRRRRRRPGIAALLGFGWELGATAAVFVVAGVLARPAAASTSTCPPASCRPTCFTTAEIPVGRRRRRRVSPHVVLALRANAALRGLGGFLTIFPAFLVQAEFPDGWEATLALGAVAAAAGVGSFAGTAAGSRLHAADPDRLVLYLRRPRPPPSRCSPRSSTASRWRWSSLVVAAVTNALGKVSLDAIIQREVPESLRASAFARSETVLQLAWVVGGAFGIALPPTGWLGLHRRRGAARPRRRAGALEPVPRRPAPRRAPGRLRPTPRPTPVGQPWS